MVSCVDTNDGRMSCQVFNTGISAHKTSKETRDVGFAFCCSLELVRSLSGRQEVQPCPARGASPFQISPLAIHSWRRFSSVALRRERSLEPSKAASASDASRPQRRQINHTKIECLRIGMRNIQILLGSGVLRQHSET
uniref:Uncharacterized protein n=1 Tax=Grammatophora oceanica TaxID=210454 RepID=A0A7S1UMN5_9STRA